MRKQFNFFFTVYQVDLPIYITFFFSYDTYL